MMKINSKKIKNKKGFVLLFAVTLASVLLSIALGISQVVIKESAFSTSAKSTNNAFFAADTGSECALFYDNTYDSTQNAFGGSLATISCAGVSITPTQSPANVWKFVVSGLGGLGQGCAKVTVDKATPIPPLTTIVTSLGYNNGGAVSGACTPTTTAVERDLQTTY